MPALRRLDASFALALLLAGPPTACAAVTQLYSVGGAAPLGPGPATVPPVSAAAVARPPPPGVERVAAGAFHTVALAGSLLYAMGGNEYGQLGDNTTTDRPAFVRMVAVWGGTPVTALAAGHSHTVALAGGRPYAVGYNWCGQLGDGSTAPRLLFVPMRPGWKKQRVVATAAAAGTFHTVVLAGGSVFSVGGNSLGQLGDGTRSQRLVLRRVVPAWGSATVAAVAAGNAHTVVLAGGKVYAAGANWHGELGDGSKETRPAFVPVAAAWDTSVLVVAIAAGASHTVVLAGNVLFAVGHNGRGQLGTNGTAGGPAFVRMAPAWGAGVPVTAVAAGEWHTVALAGGVAYAVGSNSHGQLGAPTPDVQATFAPVPPPTGAPGLPITAVAAGSTHTVLLAGTVGRAAMLLRQSRGWLARASRITTAAAPPATAPDPAEGGRGQRPATPQQAALVPTWPLRLPAPAGPVLSALRAFLLGHTDDSAAEEASA
eukprot:EG_transcript_3609